jgi:tryptophan synthase alpha chain
MSKIQAVFERLQAQGRKALIPFITAGDPDPALTVPLLHSLVLAGADIIELGVPFSDPDGRWTNHPAGLRASSGEGRQPAPGARDWSPISVSDDQHTPIVLMGYANPIESMGVEAFAAAAFDAGVDGVLVVDYPPEEGIEFARSCIGMTLDPIFLLAPTSSEARISQVGALASGYIYYVSLKG